MAERQGEDGDGMTKRLLIDAALVVKNVAVLQQSILDSFEEDDTISLDLAEGQAVDLCGLQLIESARRHARTVGKTLVLERPATEFKPVLDAAGFLTDATSDDLQFWLHEGPAQ
ncbi:STAS domain-containing protein [Brevundimonas sp.]|jgi:anti-anti-sigma regulatory factor|uniref:STAS domain-containing protein n=1 Tax=Brevundimonas sp. TaxID=1871086 RepID=UPI0017C58673|nr:STAS domain-containing protein [Brevundimonas sp.]MBA4808487.1 STAS domain-containing protein [Brevundimonas sp.]